MEVVSVWPSLSESSGLFSTTLILNHLLDLMNQTSVHLFCFILFMVPITNLIFQHANHYYFTNMQHFPSSVENAIDLFRNVYQCVCYYL
ncbi:hypothetical protein Hanom_Chr02g00109051 [Helianthus anomalus]